MRNSPACGGGIPWPDASCPGSLTVNVDPFASSRGHNGAAASESFSCAISAQVSPMLGLSISIQTAFSRPKIHHFHFTLSMAGCH